MVSTSLRRVFLGVSFAGFLVCALAIAHASPGLPHGRWGVVFVLACAVAALFPGLTLAREWVLWVSMTSGTLLRMRAEDLPRHAAQGLGRKLLASLSTLVRPGRHSAGKPDETFLGLGFEWTPLHVERLQAAGTLGLEPSEEVQARVGGSPLLHGVGVHDEHELFIESGRLTEHMLVCGAPGSGKSRFLEFLITQAIRQGDIVVVVDPKGDKRLLNAMIDAADRAGRRDDFRMVSPYWSKASSAYNPLTNFLTPTDIANRIMGIFPPPKGESEVFQGYQWHVIFGIAQAIAMADLPMTFTNLYRYVLDPVELFHELVERRFKDTLGGPNLSKAAQEYPRLVASGQMEQRPELDEILHWVHEVEENGSHYGKMTASLRPQLGRLTAGVFREILSPVPDDTKKEILTWSSALSRGQIVYFYLGHLHGEASASALGKMILLDFQSFIGKIYSYQPGARSRRVLLVVDEAHHMVSKPFTTILAEGRGANIACVLATQTVAQFEHSMGDKAFVNEILTNVHAMIHFQSRDPDETREFSDLVGKRLMRSVGESQQYEPGFFGSGLKNIDDFRARYTRSANWQDADLIPPWLLTKLPKFHYFGLIGGRPVKARVPLLDPPASTFAEDIIAQGAHA